MKWLQTARHVHKYAVSRKVIFAPIPNFSSSFIAKGARLSSVFTRKKSHAFQVAAKPYNEMSTYLSHYSKDFAYLPFWRQIIQDDNLETVAGQKDHLEVRFRSATAGSGPSHEVCHYSYDWLRDICRCDECFNKVTHNKQTAIPLQPPRPKSVAKSEDGNSVEVSWVDGHESRYPKKLLLTQHVNAKEPRGNDPVIDAQRQLWGSELPESRFRKYEFESLINDDQSVFDWLTDLRETGISVISNAPRKPGPVMDLCNRVAYPRPMCWGSTFQVEVKENASHVAYSNQPLPLHTDAAYYMFPTGVQLLHCIKAASSGGVSHVADGFRAAEIIRQTDPECFDLLTKIEWEYFEMGDDYLGAHHLQSRHPVIRIDGRGTIQQIVYSDHSRGCRQDHATSTSPAAYGALRKYSECLNAEDSVLKFTLQDGDILVVDNFRVLHGRSTVDPGSARHLEGGYLDWDEICSKLRSLGRALSS